MDNFIRTGVLLGNNQEAPVQNPGIQPRGNNYNNFGQPARVEDYIQPAPQQYGAPQGYGPQPNYGYQQPAAPMNNNRRTINNGNGGY